MPYKAKKKKETYKRDANDPFLREGWKRFTTYYRVEHIDCLKNLANEKGLYLMDLIDEIITKYRKKLK